jgi:hypothetical protein
VSPFEDYHVRLKSCWHFPSRSSRLAVSAPVKDGGAAEDKHEKPLTLESGQKASMDESKSCTATTISDLVNVKLFNVACTSSGLRFQ